MVDDSCRYYFINIMKQFKIALCQITPSFEKEQNIKRAISMVQEAASNGAELVALPEMFYHPFELQKLQKIAADESDTVSQFCRVAREKSIYLCTGSMAFLENGNIYNRSFLISPSGQILLKYDKCHLFDVDFNGLIIKESSVFTPGSQVCSVQTELGKIGIVICYDIRFPELLRKKEMLGLDLLIVPAVFNRITGPLHWHLFMRTRAVENQMFLAAVSQGENRASSYRSYGHSLLVSPWGEIISEAADQEQIVYAVCNPGIIEDTRKRLPLLQQRRESLYKDD